VGAGKTEEKGCNGWKGMPPCEHFHLHIPQSTFRGLVKHTVHGRPMEGCPAIGHKNEFFWKYIGDTIYFCFNTVWVKSTKLYMSYGKNCVKVCLVEGENVQKCLYFS
jgi:hypothetical protein